jgi:hypothetical protein
MKPRIHHRVHKSMPTDPILRPLNSFHVFSVLKRDDEFKKTLCTTKAFFKFVTELTNSVLLTNVELKGK